MKFLKKLFPLWLAKAIYNIREFFWPLLDDDEEEDDNVAGELESKTANDDSLILNIEDVNLKTAFDLQQKITDSERQRRDSIESKASLFISTISLSTSVVVGANTLIVGNFELTTAIKFSVFISFILTIYTVRTVWFSVRALERKGYHTLDIRDINIGGNERSYYRNLIRKMDDQTKKNYPAINSKVDNFVLAKAYFERAIVVICIYALSVLIFCFVIKKAPKIDRPLKPFFIACLH